MVAVAAVSTALVEVLAPHVASGGRNPLEPATVAILLGITLRAVGWVPARCGAVAMVALPFIGVAMALNEIAFGVWAGLAVPSTPQVVGSGYMFSTTAGAQATVVKLTRNIFMIPAVFVLSVWCSRSDARPTMRGYARALPGFVFGFLVLVSG